MAEMDEEERKYIEKTHAKKAKGVKWHRGETNEALAERDYSVKCRMYPDEIACIQGYHIWWCESHHQPYAWCEKEKLELEIKELKDNRFKALKALSEVR